MRNIVFKLMWACAPLLWGGIAWFFLEGPGNFIPYRLVVLSAILLLSALLYPTLEYARKHYNVMCFEYAIPIPPWFVFVGIATSGLLFFHAFTDIIRSNPLYGSLLMGVIVSATLEELIARPLFVAVEMGSIEALILNLISSFSFSLMHMGFEPVPATAYEYIFVRGHFLFSFVLGLLAYKTRRIEVCILLHMLSNFLRYTFPVLILGQPFNVPISQGLEVLTLIMVAGSGYRLYKNTTAHS